MMRNEIIHGDVCDVLRRLPPASVHDCVTSPPYWGLRDYGLPPTAWPPVTFTPAAGLPPLTIPAMTCCLGLEPTPWAFVGHLVVVFREVRRVLRDDGVAWVNLGDSYFGSWGNYGDAGGGQRKKQTERFDRRAYADKAEWRPPTSLPHFTLKSKDLCGIPWMVAKALQADGWWLRSDIIWAKPNPMPESVTDRPTKAHEYLFLLAKSGTPQFWTHRDLPGVRSKPAPDWRWIHAYGQELTEPPSDPNWKRLKVDCPECGGSGKLAADYADAGLFGGQSFTVECERCGGKGRVKAWEKVNLWCGHDYYYDAEAVREAGKEWAGQAGTFNRINGKWTDLSMPGQMHVSHRERDDRVPAGRNRRSVWTIATESYKEAHFATFPQALVEPCILAGSSARGCCPACGAPWARVVERDTRGPGPDEFGNMGANGSKWQTQDKQSSGFRIQKNLNALRAMGRDHDNPFPQNITTGWRPTCTCDAGDPVPALILDPFFGSGTTGRVAIETGRAFVGIELSEEYIELARKRLTGAQPALFAKGLE